MDVKLCEALAKKYNEAYKSKKKHFLMIFLLFIKLFVLAI